MSPPPQAALLQAPAILRIVLVGEALAAILALSPAIEVSRWVFFCLMSLLVQWISLLSLGLLYVLRRPLGRYTERQVAWAGVLALVVVSILFGAIGAAVVPKIWPISPSDWIELATQVTAMMAIVGMLSALAFENHVRSKELATRVKQAELEALLSRIRPHFLFNTLNSVTSLVHKRPQDAERILLDLGDLFRAALAEPGWVPFDEEVELCRRYMDIEQRRFGDRLSVQWRLPTQTSGIYLPLLSIQPLLENAISHGLEGGSGERLIQIEAVNTPEEVRVTIFNPLPDAMQTNRRKGHGVGISGARARIQSVTNGAGKLVTQTRGGLFEAIVTLPKWSMPIDPTQATSS